MFFWIGLAVVFVVFVCLVTWGVRGYLTPGSTSPAPGTSTEPVRRFRVPEVPAE